jgi:hypothetical protein
MTAAADIGPAVSLQPFDLQQLRWPLLGVPELVAVRILDEPGFTVCWVLDKGINPDTMESWWDTLWPSDLIDLKTWGG